MCSLDGFQSCSGFILFLAVDNCTLWCLFQEDHASYINHWTVALETFITALNVNLMFEFPPIYMLACVQFSNTD